MKVWYSFRNDEAYKGDAPAFFDLSGTKWFDDIVAKLPAIRQDILKLVEAVGSRRGTYFNTDLVEGQTWEGIGLLLWGGENEAYINEGKEVLEYFSHVPGLVSFSVSVLSPHTHIKAHYGDTDAIYRIHIPISIPAMLPECGFKVSGYAVSWDKPFAFSDAHLHEAWNDTDKPRVVVIMDVIREELLPRKNEICYNVLSYLEIQKLYMKYKMVRNAPWYIQGIIRHMLLARIYITGKSTMSGM